MVSPEPTTNLYLVTGTDEVSIRKTAAKLVQQLAGEEPDPFRLDVITPRDDVSSTDLLNQATMSIRQPPFMGGGKTVWLKDFPGFESEPRKGDKSSLGHAFRGLCDTLGNGLPEDLSVVLSGPGADGRKQLAKVCREMGEVLVCARPDIKDRKWQQEMVQLVQEVAKDKGVSLAADAVDYLVQVLGTDSARIGPELEKAICYADGTERPIGLEDVQAVCRGEGEAISWSLLDAAGYRRLPEALRLTGVLLRQEKEPDNAVLGLILQLARRYRELLQLRVYMQKHGIRQPARMQQRVERLGPDDKKAMRDHGFEFAGYHPYRVMKLSEQAVSYSGPELVEAVVRLRDANWTAVSARVAKRVVLEQTLVDLMSKETTASGTLGRQ